ncbi:MAG: phenylalanine--tRNA ligase subunit beta [bacterium]|jgi:phenylalanyl-tRNA synthetase beta chain|nr:phenylalanine--tRNA ligase subunit beta [Candidatus Neomarinimicrobiota bacterium]MDX9779453.1 phenylalanine--tRNA ligase subunit beta [bacterium]
MIVSIDWLKDYIDIDIPLEELAEKLTVAGAECTLKQSGIRIPDGVLVAKVLDTRPHPNAEKLSVCKVDTGTGEILNIVCGAPNVIAGRLVPVATVGTKLAPDFELKEVRLRGELSQGMICAEDELGLGNDHSGIMLLPDDYEIGRPFADYYPVYPILDVEVTANRPDLMSHWGLVRMISVITGKPFKKVPFCLEEKEKDIREICKISVEAPEGCPRYSARVVKNVRIQPSPAWLRQRLESVGLRPVNNVVDAANYVLMETGHPLHTFDLDKLAGPEIRVRFAVKGEKFETLDHKERTLSEKVLLICDAKNPVALAGLMGGLASEVDDNTRNILIESAYFTPSVIRRASKDQQLSTDASKRFERGTDPNAGLEYARDRLAALIAELTGGEIAKGVIDVYPEPIPAKRARLNLSKVKSITGIELSGTNCRATLEALGFEILNAGDNFLDVGIPTFRPDVEREIDLVEEVAVNHMDKIPTMERMSISIPESFDTFHPFTDKTRQFFTGYGMHEAINNSLVSEAAASAGIWGYPPLKILNPLSLEMNMLRTDMIQPLLGSLRVNALRKRGDIRLFELANVIERDPASETGAREHYNLGVLCSSSLWGLSWTEAERSADFFYMKGILEHFMDLLGFTVKLRENTQNAAFETLYDIMLRKEVIGKIGQYRGDFFEKLQLQHPLVIMELQLGTLYQWYEPRKQHTPPPAYPSIFRDLSLVMDKTVRANTLINEIMQQGGKYLIDCLLYDMYIDEKKLGEDKKALSFRLEFRSEKETLKDSQIDNVMNKLFKQLENQYGARLR